MQFANIARELFGILRGFSYLCDLYGNKEDTLQNMRKHKINSIEEALHLFEESTERRGEALDNDDFKTYNKFLSPIYKCIAYLHEQQQLHLLYRFLTHKNYMVRSTTAYVLLPMYEKDCIKVLNEIINGNYGIQCLNAKRILMSWKNGELKFPYQVDYYNKSTSKEDKPSVVVNSGEKSAANENASPEILRLSRIFQSHPVSDTELCNEEIGLYIKLTPEKQNLTFNVNTFVNPYTQDVTEVYQQRLERFKAFENIATISTERPSKLGYMKIWMTIPEKEATDDVLIQIKDTVYSAYQEWKPNESRVCFKTDYNGAVCYFEGEWWMPTRAVIKNEGRYERYDFSDENKYDEQMWEIVQGEYDEFENSESFALITLNEFQMLWEATEYDYKPEPF